jgi:hypothetical protein
VRFFAAASLCATVASSGAFASDCCSPKNTPGCDQPACVAIICPQDPFCCIVQWDSLCADAALALCDCGVEPPPDPCAASTNDCFTSGSGPGCNDAVCCQTVCAADPFCCTNSWDGLCADYAVSFCDGAPTEPAGCGISTNDCFEISTGPGCADATCCASVCAVDPFCCNSLWDFLCVKQALELCETGGPIGCPAATNDCIDTSVQPGCADAACCDAVCAIDPTCCVISWDLPCVQVAVAACDLVPVCGTSSNDCFTAVTTPGCSDEACCLAICPYDPACCIAEWDQSCVSIALAICEGGPPSGCGISTTDCLTPSAQPGCSDEACCNAVCAIDSFCCNNAWDSLCVQAAQANCAGGEAPPLEVCGTTPNSCFEIGGPGCADAACCQFVCAQDPFCCQTSWDGFCVEAANQFCAPTQLLQSACAAADHDCDTVGTPGCIDETCCAMVCSYAPDCCVIAWDAMCVDLALRGCGSSIVGDINGDAAVNGADLALLLSAWGACPGCDADLDGNGAVDATDLAVLLAGWTV